MLEDLHEGSAEDKQAVLPLTMESPDTTTHLPITSASSPMRLSACRMGC